MAAVIPGITGMEGPYTQGVCGIESSPEEPSHFISWSWPVVHPQTNLWQRGEVGSVWFGEMTQDLLWI